MNTIEEKVVELKNLLEKQGVSWNDPEDEGAQQILFEHEKLLRQALQEVVLDTLGNVEEYIKEHQEYPSGEANGAWIYNGGIFSHISSLRDHLTTGKL